jgi:hypothetical protein
MTQRQTALMVTLSSALLLGVALLAEAGSSGETPETVIVTYHAKRGSENELARVIARHWSVARRLNLVRNEPHVTLRGSEGSGAAYFVEILTWRDGSIPDNAPAAIRQLWDQMNALVESRDGKPGLDFTHVEIVSNRPTAGRPTAAPSKLPGQADTGIAGID